MILHSRCISLIFFVLALISQMSSSHAFMAPTTSSSTSRQHHSRQRTIHGELQSTTSEEASKTQVSKKPFSKTITGPPQESKPDYEHIHGPLGPLADKLFLVVFRNQMANKVGIDSDLPKDDYMGLMELTAAMNARFSDRRQVQTIAQDVLSKCEWKKDKRREVHLTVALCHVFLGSLFPSWMPPQYKILFSKPFPQVRNTPVKVVARSNFLVTYISFILSIFSFHVE